MTGFEFSPNKTKAIHICRSRKRRRPHVDPILKMNNELIEVVGEMKILGVIFDKKLNWKAHIDRMRARARQKLNFMKAITGTKWGADEETLLMFHEALILSTLEYGSEVYNSASKTQLKKVDSIHHQGLRIATGAFRTTPCESLYGLTGKLSMERRREIKILSLGLRISTMENHLIKIKDLNQENFSEKSFLNKFLELQSALGVNLNEVIPAKTSCIPPWLVSLKIDLSLTIYKKDETPPAIMAGAFN